MITNKPRTRLLLYAPLYSFLIVYLLLAGYILAERGLTLYKLFTDSSMSTSMYGLKDVVSLIFGESHKGTVYDRDLVFLTMETLKLMFLVSGLCVASLFLMRLLFRLRLANRIRSLNERLLDGDQDSKLVMDLIYAGTQKQKACHRMTFPIISIALSASLVAIVLTGIRFFKGRFNLLSDIFSILPPEWRMTGDYVLSLLGGFALCYSVLILVMILTLYFAQHWIAVLICKRMEVLAQEIGLGEQPHQIVPPLSQ